MTATGIPKELLSQVLAVLVKAKVLINEETEQYDLNPSEYNLALIWIVAETSRQIGFKSKKVFTQAVTR